MELKDMLLAIKTMNNKKFDNDREITKLKSKQDKLVQDNARLEENIEKVKQLIHKQRLLQVNIADLCKELVNTLHFDGVTVRPIHKGVKLSKEDLPSLKEFLKEKNLRIDISLLDFKDQPIYNNFILEFPLKDVVLNDGTKLINQLTVEDNAIVVPEELESKIMLNISLSDRAMTESPLFKISVLKCIEKSPVKVAEMI